MTKSGYAKFIDCKEGKTLWMVWLGCEKLKPEAIRVAGYPYKDSIGWWIPTYRSYGKTYESLDTLGILGPNSYSSRHTFVSRRAAEQFCKDNQNSSQHARYLDELTQENSFADWSDDWDVSDYYNDTTGKEVYTRNTFKELAEAFRNSNVKEIFFWDIPQPKHWCEWPQFLVKNPDVPGEFLLCAKIESTRTRVDGRLTLKEGKLEISGESLFFTLYKGVWYEGWSSVMSNDFDPVKFEVSTLSFDKVLIIDQV